MLPTVDIFQLVDESGKVGDWVPVTLVQGEVPPSSKYILWPIGRKICHSQVIPDVHAMPEIRATFI